MNLSESFVLNTTSKFENVIKSVVDEADLRKDRIYCPMYHHFLSAKTTLDRIACHSYDKVQLFNSHNLFSSFYSVFFCVIIICNFCLIISISKILNFS